MAEIDDLIRGALGRMTVDVDIAAAQRAVRRRIGSGEVGPGMEIAPGWRVARWGWSAHRAAWTSFIVVLAAVALLVTWGLGGFASPNEPTPGMTPPAPVTGRSTTSATVGTTTVDSLTAPTASPPESTQPSSASVLSSTLSSLSATLTEGAPLTSSAPITSVPRSSVSPPSTRTTPRSSSAPTTAAPTATAPTSTSNPSTTTARVTTTPTTSTSTSTSTSMSTPTSTEVEKDNEAPTIVTVFATSNTVSPGQTVSIVVQATDNVGVTSVQLSWAAEGRGLPPGKVAMTPSVNGWLWTWTVPDIKQNGSVRFVATALDAAGHRSAPASVTVAVSAKMDEMVGG